jgi:signal transduction histidine kinase
VSGDGVAVIDPHAPPVERRPALPLIERIAVDGSESAPVDRIALSPRTQTLQIDYTSLSLSLASKLRFRYMLEGFSEQWVEAGQRRQASYTNLRPGNYRFRVNVTGDGAWKETEATWNFTIPPPFYQRYWFYGLCALAAGIAVWTLWWLRLRAVRNEFALVIAERARVSRDIHDTLLQSLGAFSLQLEIVALQMEPSQSAWGEMLRDFRSRVGQCIREARRSIWELRSPRLESHDLIDAFREMADDATRSAEAQVQVVVNGKPRRSSPKVEEQLLKIGQEAVANAVHHGHADNVEIRLQYGRRSISLSVCDNGCGFVPEEHAEPNNGHWGLKKMKERAVEVSGCLKVTSHPGRGTVVETVVPF